MTMSRKAQVHSWDSLPVDHPVDLIDRRRIFGEQMMVAQVELKKGFRVAPHEHDSEQIAVVLSGKIRFELFDTGTDEPRVVVLEANQVLHLPGGVRHGAEALEETLVLDLFSPPSQSMGVDQEAKA